MNTHNRALTLNKQANEYALKMRYSKAIIYYKESLALYIALAKCNPLSHGLAIAHIFSNLAIIYLNLEQAKRADEFHQNALKMHRALTKTNPSKYALDLSCCLIDGVRHLGEHPFTLYEAKMALYKVQDRESKVAELTKIIDTLHLDNISF